MKIKLSDKIKKDIILTLLIVVATFALIFLTEFLIFIGEEVKNIFNIDTELNFSVGLFSVVVLIMLPFLIKNIYKYLSENIKIEIK
jgi:hypothetical protein